MPERTCSIEGCTSQHSAFGLCEAHRRRWRKYGDPLGRAYPEDHACAVEGCLGRRSSRGWCDMHYRRWRANGDPLVKGPGYQTDGKPDERFWARVEKNGSVPAHRPDLGPCWIWTGARRPDGYGIVGVALRVHRLMYELVNGEIPGGLTLDHLCHTGSGCPGGPTCPHRPCCNPDHLEPVTRSENVLRGHVNAAIGKNHCKHGHELTPENIYLHPGGGRRCRRCHAEYERRRRARE